MIQITSIPGVRVISPSLHFQTSNCGVKHLAGHQFVIGRVVTGTYSSSPLNSQCQANTARVWEWVKHRNGTKLAGRMLKTEEQGVAYLYRSEYDRYRNCDCLLDSKSFYNGEFHTTLNTNHCISRILASRSLIVPSLGGFL